MSTKRLSPNTFPSEWQGGTVPETWPVSVVLWPGSAPSHKLCEQGHSLDGKTGSHLARISSECTLHAFANCICILFINTLRPWHIFCSNLLTRSSSIAYWLTLSRTVNLVHCTPSSARIRGSEKKIPNVPMSDLQVGCIYTGHMIATIWRNAWGEKSIQSSTLFWGKNV